MDTEPSVADNMLVDDDVGWVDKRGDPTGTVDVTSDTLNRCLIALEHPTVKVPYESLNRKYRSAQKTIDKEVSAVASSVSEVQAALATSPTPAPKQLQSLIQGVLTQVKSLKRKARDAVSNEIQCAQIVKKRVQHLQEATPGRSKVLTHWENTRVDRLLTDYLLREGCYETAKMLVERRNIHNLTNLEIFESAFEVEKSLLRKDVSKCLAWCHDNKSRLKKMNSSLEFKLRVQEFIEMVKKGERLNAVWHARKYFNGTQLTEQLQLVQRCMALLAFPTNTSVPEYQDLLDDKQWEDLVSQFRAENLRLFQLCPQASLTVVLQAGLTALKTPQCYKSNKESFNPDCPVCMPSLNFLAKDLPYAHCSQSRLVCQMSGELLNEHNLPLMLPNGYVYGSNALRYQAASNQGEIFCPRSNETFHLDDVQKVYVM